VEKTDRLYRNFKDYLTIEALNLELHLVKENAILTNDSRSSEKLVHGIQVLMAKNYIDNLSEEVQKGLRTKAAQGLWPSFAALGYVNTVGPGGKRIIVPDPGPRAPVDESVYVVQIR
jgi:site-specific DNA recombinase